VNLILIFLIAFVVLGLFFFVGEWASDEERSADIRRRFALNVATVFLGLPAVFFLAVGILRIAFSSEQEIRSEGVLWVLFGAALFYINMLVRKKILPRDQ
jgi:drug/metabolite transporter (DMT)-like permease